MPKKGSAEQQTNIAALVARSGMTQTEVARRAGIDRGQLSLYCSGKARPNAPNAVRLAKALGASVADIMGAPADQPTLTDTPMVMEYVGHGIIRLRIDCRTTMDIAQRIAKILDEMEA